MILEWEMGRASAPAPRRLLVVAFVLRRSVPLTSRMPILEAERARPEPDQRLRRKAQPCPFIHTETPGKLAPELLTPSVVMRHSKDREILSQEVPR